MKHLLINKAEIESFARMYWALVYREYYGHSMACDKLKLYGLSDSSITKIVNYSQSHADAWDSAVRAAERNDS